MDTRILYQKAEKFLPWNLHNTIFNCAIIPYWSEKAVYYFQQTEKGKILIKININSGKKESVVDYEQILDFLHKYENIKNIEQPLSISNLGVSEDPEPLINFIYNDYQWQFSTKRMNGERIKKLTSGHLVSPNNEWELALKDNNLILISLKEKQRMQITADGKNYYSYGTSPETNTYTVTQRLQNILPLPIAIWSPNSQKIVTHKLDQRKVKNLFLLQNVPLEGQRPKLHTYRMSFSGDTHLPLAELIIIDIKTKSIIPIKTDPLLSPYLTPIEFKWVWWSEDCTKIYFIRETRGAKKIILYSANAETGETEVLLTETAKDTYVAPSPHALWEPEIIILEKNNNIIWLSEKSGYAHLYLLDKDKNTEYQITSGDWCVRKVHFYEEKSDWLYFTACGYDQQNDPYYKNLYRCHVDGSEMQCLTPENACHTIYFSPQKNCFLDTYSTINTAPLTVLKGLDGKAIASVELADLTGLKKLNWVVPKRFSVKARDGITEIYGNLYFPSHFNPNKKYPIIDHIYPGPQMHRTPTNFNLYGSLSRSTWLAQAIAELGFIVIHLDGLGTPGRSKGFHDATYKNISDCGIPDHVTAIQQLSLKYGFIDLDKIGITGYSGGGYAAMRAMLLYPDFYKVGVSAAGNHDLRCYPANYGEKYNGLDKNTYPYQSNAYLAENLKGNLLLIHGEMDDNVHPCATLQLVDALIKHNKDFEMIIMPNQNHNSTPVHPYYIRKTWDFFVKHLLGIIPPNNYSLTEMPKNFPQLI